MPTLPPTPLVASDAHLAHAGLIELVGGREVPCFESPERATVIRDALLGTRDYRLTAPDDHGPDPIAAVHELEATDFKLDFGYHPGLPPGRHELHVALAPERLRLA